MNKTACILNIWASGFCAMGVVIHLIQDKDLYVIIMLAFLAVINLLLGIARLERL